MPGNPWDLSQILLSNNAGQNVAAGISSAGSSLASGITSAVKDYRQKKKEKEAEDAAIQYLQKNGKEMGLDHTDPAELKAAVKAAGGGLQAIQLISGLEQQKQQRAAAAQQQQVTAAELAHLQAASASRLRSSGAARLAAGGMPGHDETGALLNAGASFNDLTPAAQGENPDAVVAGYLRRSGDIGGAGQLSEGLARLAALKVKDREPRLLDFGPGRAGVQDAAGNFHVFPVDKPGAQPVDVGGGRTVVAVAGTPFDKGTGQPIQTTPDRAPNPPPFELKATDPELYDAMRSHYLDWTSSRKPSAGEPSTLPAEIPGKAAGTGGTIEIGTQADFDKLKPGTRFTYKGRIGIKK